MNKPQYLLAGMPGRNSEGLPRLGSEGLQCPFPSNTCGGSGPPSLGMVSGYDYRQRWDSNPAA